MPLLTTKQFREWRMYYEIEPFGAAEHELQHSYTRKILAEGLGGKSKSGKGFSIFDLSLSKLRSEERKSRRKGKTEKQSVDEMKNILQSIANISNGKNKRKK